MKKIIALLILAVSMAAAQTVVTGNGVTGAQGSGNVSPSADAASDIGTLLLRWQNLYLSGTLKWTNGSGTADTGISRFNAAGIAFGNGTQGDPSATVFATNYQDNFSGLFSLRSATGGLSLGAASGTIKWSNNNNEGLGSYDLSLSRGGGAGILAVGNGTAADFSGTVKSATDLIATANGATWTQTCSSELLTIAAAATTDTVGNLLPANSIIKSVMVRVVTVIPTAATFTVGDATIAARFATGVAVAATTTAIGLTQVDQTGTSGPKQTAAAKVRITPNLTPGTATGQVRVTVCADTFVAPTS